MGGRKKADKLYKNQMKNRAKPFKDREVCKSKYCLLFPIDRKFENDMTFQCSSCKQEMHYLCEGFTELSVTIRKKRETYKCHNCCDYTVVHNYPYNYLIKANKVLPQFI